MTTRRRLVVGGTAVAAVLAVPGLLTRSVGAGAERPGQRGAGASGAPAAGPRTRPGTVDVRDFGAVGDGSTDDHAAITAATAALRPGGTLVFAPGQYLVSTSVSVQGKRDVFITGAGATIVSTDQQEPVVVLTGDTGLVFTGFEVRHASTSGGRTGGGFGIKVARSSGITIRGCLVHSTSSAGVVSQRCTGVRIADNTVRDTLADGIHTTGGSRDVTIVGNTVTGTGDDAIPVVSYRADGALCRNVTISGNTVRDSQARGIDVVGGRHVAITGNVVDGTRAAGIMVAQETSFATFGSRGVTIAGNTVTRAVTVLGPPVHHAAIMVDCTDPRYPVSGITIQANTVRTPRLEGLTLSGPARGVQDVVVSDNVFDGPSREPASGILVTVDSLPLQSPAPGITVRGNAVRRPDGDGITVTTTGAIVTANDVVGVPAGAVAYRVPASTDLAGNSSS